jgi:hypothetical protein
MWEEDFLLGCMPHNAAVTGDAYAAALLRNLKVVKEKRRPLHKSRKIIAAVRGWASEKLNYSSYSPALTPSNNVFPVPKLEEMFAWASVLKGLCT